MGNVRVSFARNSAGALQLKDNNDYYPFGMNHLKTGNSYFGAGSYVKYKFGGKELQETGMYDFGARMYMADIGRWFATDPMAEANPELSVYRYGFNNPIMFTDPNGMLEQALTNRMLELGGNWKNEGNGFKSDDNIKLGYNGNYLSLNTNLDDNFNSIINIPGVTLSGYGRAKYWGAAISTYNINHGILYNGIDDVRKAWNLANQSFDPMAWVRSDGPIKYMGSAGDPFGFWEGLGIILSSSDNKAMNLAALPLLVVTKNGDDALKLLAAERGAFSVADWGSYPSAIPKPSGPFRILEGAEYEAARKAANRANQAIRKADPETYRGLEIHEIHPVKYGGSATDPANKIAIPRDYHRKVVTPWWNDNMRSIKKIP